MKQIVTILLLLATTAFGQWHDEWSKGVSVKNTKGGFAFSFPVCDNHANEVVRSFGNLPVGGTITATVRMDKISGNPKFKSLDPAPAPPSLLPNCRFMLQRPNDDWRSENNRWWPSGASCVFLKADGNVYTYAVKLKPNLWTNVYGKYNAAEFKKTLGNMGNLAIVFGGGNSFAHGVCGKGGVARYNLLSLKVTK